MKSKRQRKSRAIAVLGRNIWEYCIPQLETVVKSLRLCQESMPTIVLYQHGVEFHVVKLVAILNLIPLNIDYLV